MLEVGKLYILQMWRPDLAAWWDVRESVEEGELLDAADYLREDGESKARVIPKVTSDDGAHSRLKSPSC